MAADDLNPARVAPAQGQAVRIALLVSFCGSLAAAQPPTLTDCFPLAVRPGQPVDLRFTGENLASATGVWATFPQSAQSPAPPAAKEAVFRVSVPAETPPGIAGVRVFGAEGVSNLRLLAIDDLPTVPSSANHHDRQAAQVIEAPLAVDGACAAEQYDYFKFAAAAGQRLSFEVLARRLGSPLDPVLRLLDAAGRELAYSDDEPTTGADCRFAYSFTAAGEYYLELRDIRYQGGEKFRYRLRVGDFPLPAAPFPLAVAQGTLAAVELAGPKVSGIGPLALAVPPGAVGQRLPLTVRYPSSPAAAWSSVLVCDSPDRLEREPNDETLAATPLALPGAVEGRIDRPGDRDWFAFTLPAAGRLTFTAQTRSLGAPTHLYLRLVGADGGQLAEAEDIGADPVALDFNFAAAGTFYLLAEELLGRGGPEFAYRIVAEPFRPGFRLAADTDRLNAPQGGVLSAKITCPVRADYNGPIALAIEGAGDGWKLENNVIPEGKNETVLSATLPPQLTAGQLHQVRIVGTAKIGETEVRQAASNLSALRAAFAGWPYPPAALDGPIALGVGPVFPPFFQLSAAAPSVSLAASGNTGTLKVQATKLGGFDDKITLSVEGLPAGVSAKVPPLEKGQAEASIELTSAAGVSPGQHAIRIVGAAVFQNQPQRFVLETASVMVTP